MRTIRRSRTARIAAALILSYVLAPAAFAQEASRAEQTVNVMNQLWGKHPGIRANHAKGVVVEGSFAPSSEASTVSRAALFQGKTIPVTARFSDSTGVPNIPDGDKNANPHGLAVKFHLSDGSEVDIVENSLKFFPVATGEEFRDLLQAVAESGPEAPKPTKIEEFFASHPAAPRAFGAI